MLKNKMRLRISSLIILCVGKITIYLFLAIEGIGNCQNSQVYCYLQCRFRHYCNHLHYCIFPSGILQQEVLVVHLLPSSSHLYLTFSSLINLKNKIIAIAVLIRAFMCRQICFPNHEIFTENFVGIHNSFT